MAPPGKAGLSGVYSQLKRNKRCLAVDLKREQGIAIIKKAGGLYGCGDRRYATTRAYPLAVVLCC